MIVFCGNACGIKQNLVVLCAAQRSGGFPLGLPPVQNVYFLGVEAQ